MNYWIIGDTHFGHKVLIDKGVRPQNFEQQIITKWKNNIQKDDIVLHLGDVVFDKNFQLANVLNNLPGIKILITGNHDKSHSNSWFLKRGFSFVCESLTLKKCIFTHKPISLKSENYFNIHAHFHNSSNEELLKTEPELINIITNKHFLISLERTNYMPIPLQWILDELRNRSV